MAVVSRCRRQNIKITLHDVLRSSSLIHLAETVDPGTLDLPAQDEVLDQSFELSPIQRLYFLAAKEHQGSSRFNQSFTLRLSRNVSPHIVSKAIQSIVHRHTMLRARFKQTENGGWQQRYSSVSN